MPQLSQEVNHFDKIHIVNLKKVHSVSDILNIELTTMNKNIILKKNNNFMV